MSEYAVHPRSFACKLHCCPEFISISYHNLYHCLLNVKLIEFKLWFTKKGVQTTGWSLKTSNLKVNTVVGYPLVN